MKTALKVAGILVLTYAITVTRANKYPVRRVAIVHDYIFARAEKSCASHQGLHYVVPIQTIFSKGEREEYPCKDEFRVRCQDGTMQRLDDGVGNCFISEDQLQETLAGKELAE